MTEVKKIVFLYTELAGYIRNCMERLAAKGVEVHVFSYPINAEAPFSFDLSEARCQYYARFDYQYSALLQKVQSLNPAAIICSGWIDKGYIQVCKAYKGTIETVLALDSQWNTKPKTIVSAWRARLRYASYFSSVWVPGAPQVRFAERLGFSPDQIFTGFYTADTEAWQKSKGYKNPNAFNHRFLFVGRYVDFKGVRELWDAFSTIDRKDWELHCMGTGLLYHERPEMDGLRHFGFLQPDELQALAADGGVFILPSHHEPWGVVVQEFAAAGFPLLCTSNVGAASAFLVEGENGFLFKAGQSKEIAGAMKKILSFDDQRLNVMGERSVKLALKITVDSWVETAVGFIGN